jgi:hypothetical protein
LSEISSIVSQSMPSLPTQTLMSTTIEALSSSMFVSQTMPANSTDQVSMPTSMEQATLSDIIQITSSANIVEGAPTTVSSSEIQTSLFLSYGSPNPITP